LFGVLEHHADPFLVDNFESIHKTFVQVLIDKIAPCDLFETIVVERDGRDERDTSCEVEKVLLLCFTFKSSEKRFVKWSRDEQTLIKALTCHPD
jgi:hypothetical protein